MADIAPSHLDPISDPGNGAREQPLPQRRSKAVAAAKSALPETPKIETAEEDQHRIDEMA